MLLQLLCRMKDSTVLLQKRLVQEQADGDKLTLQTYEVSRRRPTPPLQLWYLKTSVCERSCVCVMQEFLRWFCVTLLEVLLPGASFSKCLMSLQLLCLLGQTFSFSSGTLFKIITLSFTYF